MSLLPPDAPRPRLCHVIKSNPEQEYGFDLHAEKVRGQFIGNVDDDSPAGKSGLRRGDRIVAVNGVLIVQENHKDVVKRIKEDPMQCTLVVLDEDGIAWYNERKLPIPIEGDLVANGLAERVAARTHEETSSHLPPSYNDVVQVEEREEVHHHHEVVEEIENEIHPTRHFEAPVEEMHHHVVTPHFEVPNDSNGHAFKPRPRLSKLRKTEPGDEFGFNLHAERDKGHFIGKVDSDSIAERAGLEEGQRIVGVNKTLIYPSTPHREVVGLIKQDSMSTELLVAFPEVDNWYRGKAMEFSYDDAETVQYDEGAFKHPIKMMENGKVEHHVEHIHAKAHDQPREEEIVVKVAPSVPSVVDSYPLTVKEVVKEQREDIKREPIIETKRYDPSPSAAAPTTHRQAQANGAPDLFRLSAAEMRERLSSQKKADPRKSDTSNLSLKQKYDIIQSL